MAAAMKKCKALMRLGPLEIVSGRADLDATELLGDFRKLAGAARKSMESASFTFKDDGNAIEC
jgi:hypothetical protein